MPRVITPLTDKKIKSAKPKDKTYKLFDGGGLYVEIRKTGKKIFRFKDGNITVTIGEYPIVTLAEAREWVRDKKKESLGVSSKKFSVVCDEFFEKKKDELSEKHLKTQKEELRCICLIF